MIFIGNEKTVNLLEKAIEHNKLAQAYLFIGPESVGKFTLAKKFAIKMIEGGDNKLADVDHDKYLPDLIIIEPEMEDKKGIIKVKDISVERAREVQHKLSMFPFQGKRKVAIVNDAHRLSVSAQNALLKTMEEPNSTAVIILVTHENGNILPTIHSRVQKLIFSLVPAEHFPADDDDFLNLKGVTFGRPGRFFNLKNDKDEYEKTKALVSALQAIQTGNINQRFEIAEEWSKDSRRALNNLKFWMEMLHQEKPLNGSNEIDMLFKMEKIEKALQTLNQTNANIRLVLENLFIGM